jgi:hypothetical protein
MRFWTNSFAAPPSGTERPAHYGETLPEPLAGEHI